MKLAATEVFENILMHNRSLFHMPVVIRFFRNDTVRMSIRYFTTSLCSPGLPESQFMCSNLSRGIIFRKGLFKREIIIIL